MAYAVEIYKEANEFIDSLEPKLQAKSYRAIELLKNFGPSLTMPHSRKIVGTEDLYELRVQVGTNICRLFYFYYNGEIYIVLSGYIKKQQKTDRGEIDKALKIRDAYITAMKEAETNENGNL